MSETKGKYYWCIKSDLSDNGEIYVLADKLVIDQHNNLLCVIDKKDYMPLVITSGHWSAYFAASCIDGGVTDNIEHWKGEKFEEFN